MIAVVVIAGCGKEKKASGPKELWTPDWWMLQDNPDYVNTFGIGESTSRNLSFDAAKNNAMLEAAQYVESYVQGMVKSFEEEAGVVDPTVTKLTSKVVKNVSKAKFSNTLVTKQKPTMEETPNGQRYVTYVCVSIPKETINKNMVNKIKQEEALYNAFKASQAFDSLDKEMTNYDN
ncbi:MAG: hypothetical protein J7K89_04755 [Candidatus Cloacimonetes bacterium]|nr:hypothetical protein [Candidatus Cloacimonadota bacterium]